MQSLLHLICIGMYVCVHTGGELFTLLEREGVFLEDAARCVCVCVCMCVCVCVCVCVLLTEATIP